jgi:hypothetical protein
VYECGNCVSIRSAVPGARVRVLSGSVQRGVGNAVNGEVTIHLSPVANQGDVLQISQNACGLAGPPREVQAEEGFPGLPSERLRRLKLKTPRACDKAIEATDIVPGARVVAARSTGPMHIGCTTHGELDMHPTPPLQAGEIITAHQDFPLCGPASNPIQVTVAPVMPVLAPDVFSPICAGTIWVWVKGLRVGATVHIFADGIDQGGTDTSDTAARFQVPPWLLGVRSRQPRRFVAT